MRVVSVLRYPAKVLEAIAVFLVAGVVVVITGSVVLRFFGVVPRGSTELATLFFAWMIFVGLVLGFLEGGHLAITALVSRLRGRLETAVTVLADVLLLVFLVLVSFEALRYVQLALDGGRLTPSLQISPAWQYASVLVGMVLASAFVVLRVCANLVQLWRGEPTLTLHTRYDDDIESV
ncbi:TRAP transporter small permease [Ornithinimicrobium sp. LYQ92]|uniref:TRAP transporter small permease n=1 Tax=Serinicoccus sp. LYQ92 TaxID=3378798 RepID=UPI003854A616